MDEEPTLIDENRGSARDQAAHALEALHEQRGQEHQHQQGAQAGEAGGQGVVAADQRLGHDLRNHQQRHQFQGRELAELAFAQHAQAQQHDQVNDGDARDGVHGGRRDGIRAARPWRSPDAPAWVVRGERVPPSPSAGPSHAAPGADARWRVRPGRAWAG